MGCSQILLQKKGATHTIRSIETHFLKNYHSYAQSYCGPAHNRIKFDHVPCKKAMFNLNSLNFKFSISEAHCRVSLVSLKDLMNESLEHPDSERRPNVRHKKVLSNLQCSISIWYKKNQPHKIMMKLRFESRFLLISRGKQNRL